MLRSILECCWCYNVCCFINKTLKQKKKQKLKTKQMLRAFIVVLIFARAPHRFLMFISRNFFHVKLFDAFQSRALWRLPNSYSYRRLFYTQLKQHTLSTEFVVVENQKGYTNQQNAFKLILTLQLAEWTEIRRKNKVLFCSRVRNFNCDFDWLSPFTVHRFMWNSTGCWCVWAEWI